MRIRVRLKLTEASVSCKGEALSCEKSIWVHSHIIIIFL